MIIKVSRVPTRGAALKRLIEHIENADDNDEVVALRGTSADLLDARQDARAFGRQYCVRHWIVAPSKATSFEKMLGAVDALAAEFGFKAERAVVRGHRKPKASSLSLFDGHLHILVPEILDPIRGGVLSNAHDWLRGEKVAKVLSFDWQEAFVESTKPAPILAALRRDGRGDVADAYQAAFPVRGPRPVASFDTAAQQRLKRAGLDLPVLRLLVAGALDGAKCSSDVHANLRAHGLVCKFGTKAGVYMVETVAGEQVGSLARLAKIKKAALLKLMETPHARQSEEALTGRGNLQQHARPSEIARTDQGPGGGGSGNRSGQPDRDDVKHPGAVPGESAADGRKAGHDHQLAGCAVDQGGNRGHAESRIAACDLHLALSLVPYTGRLHLMMARANRLALSGDERAIVELGEIEDDARIARAAAVAAPPEPSSLRAARTTLTDATKTLETRKSELDQAKIAVQLLQQRRPWWRLAIGLFTGGNQQRASELRTATEQQDRAQAALAEENRRRSDAESQLAREISVYRQAVKQHKEHWTQAAKVAEERAVAASRAYELLKHLPGSVRLGAAGLCEISTKLAPQADEQSFEVENYSAAPLATQP